MSLNQEDHTQLSLLIKELHLKEHTGWKNFSRNINLPLGLVLDVENLEQLQTILKTVYWLNEGKTEKDRVLLRVVAGGRPYREYSKSFSFTNGAEADVILRLVGKRFCEANTNDIKKIVSVGPSMEIGELDQFLYEHHLALATSSLIPHVTVAGLAANAGHGTGKDQPSFAGLIRALTFCLPNGKIVRIKDPSCLHLESSPYDIPVTQEEFEVIRASHFGLFGVVLNLELEVIEAKKMCCTMKVRTLPDFLEEVKKGLFNQFPYVSVMYVPTYQPDELTSKKINNVIIYCWQPVDLATKDKNYYPTLSHVQQEMQVKLQELSHLSYFLNQYPTLIPAYMQYFVSRFAVGSDRIAVGPWPMVHYQTAFPWNICDMDYLYQVSPDCNEIVRGFEGLVNELQKSYQKKEYPVDYAIYARLFGGTNGGLSTSQHRRENQVCGFDIVSTPQLKGYDEFKKSIETFFVNELKAKLHWGKYVPFALNYADMYGDDFKLFKKTLSHWYEKNQLSLEKSMFINSFFSKLLNLDSPSPMRKGKPEKAGVCHFLIPFYKYFLKNKILPLVYGDDVYAERFRQAIKEACKVHFSDVKNMFFQPSKKGLNEKPTPSAAEIKKRQ